MIGMRLQLNHRLRLVFVCKTCRRPSDEHQNNCPRHLIEETLTKEPTYRCEEAGCGGDVQVAEGDFLKCRRCLTQYSLGMIADTVNPRRVLLRRIRPDEDLVDANVLAAKGKRRAKFKIDVRVHMLRELERAWRRRWREERAAGKGTGT